MKLIYRALTFFGILVSPLVWGQEIEKSLVADQLLETNERERIYVHYNSSLVFPGEYFLYSVYNLKMNGEPSNFSKIAYVELVGKDGEAVFRQKVELENGRASADFFIPTSTPSGSYKLLAYTNWMKNIKNAFFEGDIVVINPYQSNQRALLNKDSLPLSTGGSVIEGSMVENEQTDLIGLTLNKNVFGNREQVKINLDAKGESVANGSYSISVRKIGSLPAPKRVNSETKFSSASTDERFDEASSQLYLPELRGQLISGQLVSGNGNPDASVENKRVALSLPSHNGFVQYSVTNEEGQFFFNLDKGTRQPEVVLEVVGEDKDAFEIQLNKNEGIDTRLLGFPKFSINPEMEQEIIQRSLYNQIESSYFSVKPDTIVPAREEPAFPEFMVETYHLDDYTRFKGIPETFLEIIKSARVKKESGGNSVFEVRSHIGSHTIGVQPLVMVDGLLIQDHDLLVNYDATRIKTIRIINDKIFLGPEIFQGAVLAETLEGNFLEEYAQYYSQVVNVSQPEVAKRYYKQVYTPQNKDSRIPDYRHQLFWASKFSLIEGGENLEFYTSDVDGNYELTLEGFTADGTPVSIGKLFSVQ